MVTCKECKKEKDRSKFYKDSNRKSGIITVCKECHLKYSKEYKKCIVGRYKDYRLNAKKKDLVFLVSIEEFDILTSKKCYYCGGSSGSYKDRTYTGLDRVDNSQGYEVSNLVPCCKKCNYMKKDLSIEVFLYHIRQVYYYQEIARKETPRS